MGMMKETLMLYCESQHPDSWEEQDKLFQAICDGTVSVSLEDMCNAIKTFEANGVAPTEPALTLRRVAAALGIKRKGKR